MRPTPFIAAGLLAATVAGLSACTRPTPPEHSFPVFFDDFSATIGPAAAAVVTSAANVAGRFPRATVTVTGYADRAGSPEREIALSKARADAVAALLQQDGVAAGRVTRSAVGTPPNSQPGVERRRVEIDLD